MATNVDEEIEAIRVVLTALEPLDADARASVLDYVFKRLGMSRGTTLPTQHAPTEQAPQVSPPSVQGAPHSQLHIKDFKEEKQPRSAIEMAALVAYYLENLAPETDRKVAVGASDLDTYFKIAECKLPAKQQFTLINARTAGYFDSVGGGQYKLNAVGHNLVVHSMPRRGSESPTIKGSAKKTGTMRAAKKKRKTTEK